jgi:hypothetical protein
MSAPPAVVNWADGLLSQIELPDGELDAWIMGDDKPTKIANMLWWYHEKAGPNEHARVSYGQRVRALIETVYWLTLSAAMGHEVREFAARAVILFH